MSIRMRSTAAVLVGAAALLPALAAAQTTDGYHSIQVFPIVVDSASFAQRFNFHNNNAGNITINPKYFPADGTTQATALDCPAFVIPGFGERVITSLRIMCPALEAGSQFGFVVMTQSDPGYLTYSAFSRVSNPQGNGFTVEGFAASTFTASKSVVTGVRRLAATPSSPTFQSNCFIGNINEGRPQPTPTITQVHYTVANSAATPIGSGDVFLAPGHIVRLSDVFSAAGVPAGDQNDALVTFEELGPDEPGIMGFCTVQDNTSFGADFRIAKMAISDVPGNPSPVVGAQDIFVMRDFLVDHDVLGRNFEIGTGAANNLHIVYAHEPDFVQCEIINPATGLRALPSYGLEIRALAGDLVSTGVGGNDSVVVPDPGKGDSLFVGDKSQGTGANLRTVLEVESNGQNTASVRPYKLHCRSGSGMIFPDIVRYKDPATHF